MKKDSYYKDLEKKGYYETIDKRSKDYREYKKFKENFNEEETTGLGDFAEKIIEVTGIKKIVEAVTDDCGCDKRKEKFNKLFSWKRRKISCISEEDYRWYVDNNIRTKSRWKHEEAMRLTDVYNSIFNTKLKHTKCSSCVSSRQKKLNDYIKVYNS